MKYILSVLFLFFFFSGFTQIYQEMPQYGYRANRMAFDSTLQIPTVCGVPTLKSVVSVNKKAAIAFDSCNNKFYTYNPKTLTWSEVSGGGATPPLQDVITAGNEYTDGFGNTVRFYEYESVAGVDRFYPLRFFDNDESLPSVDLVEDMYVSTQSSELKMGNFGNFEPTNFTINTSGLNIKNSYGGPTNEVNLNYDGLKIYKNESEYTNLNFLNSNNNNENYDVHLPIQNGSANDTLNTLQRFRSDTTNKWVNDVVKKNDSTITIYKGATATDITLTPSTTVASATRLVTTVYNNSGATITKGSVIYINGRHSSNLPTIALAQANTEDNSYATFALVQDDITNNNSGTIIQAGNISNLNLPTASFADGEVVYLSPTVAGGLTTNKTSVLAPNHIVKIGTITRAHPTAGSIEIRIENGWQLDELSDVQIPIVPNDSTLLQFSRVDSLWHSVGVTNAIGSNYIKPADTVSLSNRINLKVNIADTSAMLTKYLRKTDTASLSSRINLKVNIADTSSMLTPYLRSNTASATYLAKSDSTTYYTKYRSDTSRTNIYNALLGKQGTITLTTTGTSGASTLVGNTLNIPQYSGGTSYTFSTGLTNSSGTVTSNLSTGVSGGQSVVGGTDASNSLTLSSTSNATKGKILFGTSAYFENTNRLGINTSTDVGYALDVNGTARVQGATTITSGTLTNGTNGLKVTATLPTTATQTNNGVDYQITSAGTSSQTQAGLNINLLAGYTGPYDSYGIFCSNNTAGTGTTYHNSTCNMGGYFTCNATTTGTNVGNNGLASNGNKNIGLFGRAITAKNSATNVGVLGLSLNTGTSPIQIGGYFALSSADQSFTSSAALIADNGSTTSDILVARDNGTSVFSIKDNGAVNYSATNTAAGTTGNQTINKPSGTVNIAAAGTTVTVTNSLVTTSSIVFATIRTNDATAVIKNVVPAAGSFTINLNAAATAETSIGFFVIN